MEMVLSDVSSMYRAQDVYELRRFDLFTGNSIQDLEMHQIELGWRHSRFVWETFSFRLGDLDGNGFV